MSTAEPSRFSFAPVDPSLTEALAGLFDAAGCACFCRYWHFSGTKNDWQARLAFTPDDGRREMREAIAEDDAKSRGVLALTREEPKKVVAWLSVAPLVTLPKLRKQGAYRPLDLGDEESALAVGCLLVHPDLRKTGVGTELLSYAVDYARARGARALYGFPRRAEGPLYDEAAFAGPERAFVRAGFTVSHDSPAYPVYVHTLGR